MERREDPLAIAQNCLWGMVLAVPFWAIVAWGTLRWLAGR